MRSTPLEPVRIMPAQGSVGRPSAPRDTLRRTRSIHERQRPVLRPRRARATPPPSRPCPLRARSTSKARAPTSACRCARLRRPTRRPRSAPKKNPPLAVYDTSGPYTDPDARDRHPPGACPRCAAAWIAERGDTRRRSTARRRRSAGRGSPTRARRLALRPAPRAAARAQAARARNVTQMHYARRGIVTPEMEFVAIRENLKRDEMLRTLPESVTPPASRGRASAPRSR